MRVLERLKDQLETELEQITKKGDMTPGELENATKVVCLLEKIKKIENLDMEMDEEGYSEDYYPMYPAYSMRSYNGNSRRGRSYRGSYRNAYDGMSTRRSYDGSRDEYSGHTSRDQLIRGLELMMENASSDQDRMIISDCIKQLDR